MKKLTLLSVALLLALFASFAQANSYREFLLGSFTVTTSGSQATIDTFPSEIGYKSLGGRVSIECSVVSGGTPSATFTLKSQVGATQSSLGSSSAITTPTNATFVVEYIPRNVFLSYNISGTTPSFTCTAWLTRF